MKTTTLIFIAILSLSSFAESIHLEVDALEETNRERVFKLKTTTDRYSAILDCASFLHGISYKESGDNSTNFFQLYSYECEDIAQTIYQNVDSSPICLSLDLETYNYSFSVGDGTLCKED